MAGSRFSKTRRLVKKIKMITAKLNNYRQSPRKVRLVANLVKGKKVSDALTLLQFAGKRAASPLSTLISSAVANAKNNFNISKDNLYITELRVDKGVVLKRSRPRARGSAFPIRKHTSHVVLVLAEKAEKTNNRRLTTDNKKITKNKIKKEPVVSGK